MLSQLVLAPGDQRLTGIGRRLGLAVALAGLAWTLLFAGLVFVGVGLYQVFAMAWLAPWPALAVAMTFIALGLGVLGVLARSAPTQAEVVQLPLTQLSALVRDNPWESVMVATVAGVALGSSPEGLGTLIKNAVGAVQR